MGNLIGTFTLYEFLRIIIPGFYFITWLRIIIVQMQLSSFFKIGDVESSIIFVIASIIFGVFVYSFDIPKNLSFMLRDLPSNVIKQKHKEIDKIKILNSYFKFFDSLNEGFKSKTEKHSGYFHLSINMAVVNIILIIILIFINVDCNFKITSFGILFSFLILSIISAKLIYSQRLKYSYQRCLDKYFDTDEYTKLTESK